MLCEPKYVNRKFVCLRFEGSIGVIRLIKFRIVFGRQTGGE